jgi:hypothetical protein
MGKLEYEELTYRIRGAVFEQQLYSYLRATKYKVGILANFGADKLDIRRRIHG